MSNEVGLNRSFPRLFPRPPVSAPGAFKAAAPLLAILLVVGGLTSSNAQEALSKPEPRPTLPNPYRLDPDWPTLPATMKGPGGRKWGQVIRVSALPDGGVWVFHRCFNDKPAGDASCINRGEANPPLLRFNAGGELIGSAGVGLFASPHGFAVDREGNIWTTDINDKPAILGEPAVGADGVALGQTVMKISPQGKVLMVIGTPGAAGTGDYAFDRPTGVAIAPDGSIFVADGHSGNKSGAGRVVKYSPDGKFIKAWGRMGVAPGEFRDPHDIFVGGSKGYVYVADRLNFRIQVFDQDGRFITAWKQFGQPSSVYVDDHDNLYVGASYQDPAEGNVMAGTSGPNDRAIVIGDAITGQLKYLIPDPGDRSKMTDTGTSASGITVDAKGNIYAADVGFNNLRKYVRAR